ncbi:MAG: M6 family metalloprotease domain-containing protein [Prevotella sp.]|nr:M6 family metalloprotease domain-containing protein [Prevotella sp.]
MNKLYLSIAIMFASICTAMAVPAKKGSIRMQQPDGSYVTICLHGDEYLHFNTTDDGYSVVKDSRGYYVYAALEDGKLVPTAQVAHEVDARTAEEKAYLQELKKYMAPKMTRPAAEEKQAEEIRRAKAQAKAARYDYNNFKGLIILVQFNDKSFSRTDYKDIITDMVNKEDYTGYANQSFTGSVRDYFSDNSNGKFQPHFDVAGPYTVNYSQYAGGNQYMSIINAALNAADADVNFKDYDGDNNGVVDMVYFIVAGNGANYVGNDERLWWPHRSIIWPSIYKDGVRLSDYASSVELSGHINYPSTIKIDGIGTICHEFSHVLGLPDLYDTDYEGSGGESHDPDDWSVMAGGSYSNDGRTPVGYSLYERYLAGFIDEIPTITEEGSYTLDPLYNSKTGYRLDTPVNNEFFLFENRQKTMFKWDAFLPGSGMLVHRVDLTNQTVWNNNTINCNPAHNYYEVVRADGWKGGNNPSDVFPGTKNVRELTNGSSPASLKTWDGHENIFGLTNIKASNGVISFDVNKDVLKSIILPESAVVGVGMTYQLEATRIPDYAPYTFKWESSNSDIATVNDEGLVTGVAQGTATITLTANETLTATCQVKVEQLEVADGIGSFKNLKEGDEKMLILNNAQVLFANEKNVYLRDASGVLVLDGTEISASQNDILNGSVYGKFAVVDKIPYLQAVKGYTNNMGVTAVAGSEATAREVNIDNIADTDYADLITLKGGRFERIDGTLYLVTEHKSVRVYNRFNVRITWPLGYVGKYYDVTGIMLTYKENDELVDELAIMRNPIEGAPIADAIDSIITNANAEVTVYTIDGRLLTKTTVNELGNLMLKHGIYVVKSGNKVWKIARK